MPIECGATALLMLLVNYEASLSILTRAEAALADGR